MNHSTTKILTEFLGLYHRHVVPVEREEDLDGILEDLLEQADADRQALVQVKTAIRFMDVE